MWREQTSLYYCNIYSNSFDLLINWQNRKCYKDTLDSALGPIAWTSACTNRKTTFICGSHMNRKWLRTGIIHGNLMASCELTQWVWRWTFLGNKCDPHCSFWTAKTCTDTKPSEHRRVPYQPLIVSQGAFSSCPSRPTWGPHTHVDWVFI